MSKLEHLREIIDDHLRDLTMTEADRNAVRRHIAEQHTRQEKPRYGWYIATATMVMACVLAVVVVIPMLPKTKDASPELMTDQATAADIDRDADDSSEEATADAETAPMDGMSFDVLAAARTSGVVTPDTAFYIDVIGGTIDAEELETLVTLEPAVSFTIVPETETRYCLTPSEPLPDGEVIRLSIEQDNGSSLSWAFQTEDSLHILSTLPGNESTDMPAETGIEINFSRILSKGAEEAITISPAIPGKFLYYGKTVTYVPEEPLAPDTVYTVTVHAGLTADSGEVLAEDYTFAFRTPQNFYSANQYFYLANNATESYLPGDPISVGVIASDELTNASVTLWQIDRAEDYLAFAASMNGRVHPVLGNMGDSAVNTDTLCEIDRFDTEILRTETSYWYGGVSYILLPELEEGWYLAEITAADAAGGTHTLRKLVQVNPLAIYYQSIGGETIVWVNDSRTGKSLSGASVQLTADDVTEAVLTDRDGLAYLTGRADEQGYVRLEVHTASDRYVDLVKTYAEETPVSRAFRSFLYLDRSVYQPTDTVHFWGILQPVGDRALPESLDIMLSTVGEPTKIGTVEVAANGSFTGSFAFENRLSGYTSLIFAEQGETYTGTGFQIMEYTKPSYLLEAAFDQTYYRRNETMTVHVSAAFYDGTPAAGLGIQVSGGSEYETLTMDSNGQGQFVIKPQIYHDDWQPTSQYVNAVNVGSEDVHVSTYATAYYFPSDYMLTAEAVEPGSLQVEIRSNAINFTQAERYLDGSMTNLDDLRGDPAEVHGTAELWGSYYEKVKTGQSYDPIRKVNVPIYDYILKETLLSSEEFTTTNGRYLTKGYQPQAEDPYTYYRMEIRYDSPDGESFTTKIHLTTEVYPGNFYTGYHLVNQDPYHNNPRLGDETKLRLYSTEAKEQGELLMIPTTNRMLSCFLADPADVSVTFTAEMIPNASLFGAYFDGRHIYAVQEYRLFYDTSERALQVQIETDQDSFEPGETVTGRILITDEQGQPVQAAYAIGVADEAVFAVSEQYVDPLRDLYAIQYHPTPIRYTSYTDKDLVTAYAEGGGGDGYADARSDFADTAAFITGITASDGTAAFAFSLPDNLTSWRITAAAVSDDGKAGASKEHISVSLPFFLNLVMNETLTTGDDVSLSARVYGIPDGTAVQYSVYLDGNLTEKANGVAGTYTFLSLGKLPAGSHEITLQASAGDYSDGIRRTITILDSRHELMIRDRGNLEDGVQVNALRYPVILMLHDAAQADTMETLLTLLSMNGQRLDQALAVYTAASQLQTLDPENMLSDTLPNLSVYQHYTGGMKLFSYGDPDVLLTSLSLLTAADHLDTAAIRNYLYQVLYNRESSRYEVAAAYLGLAALREPVLSDLYVLLSDPNFTPEEQLLLADALAVLGDQSGAAALYETLILPKLSKTDNWCYLDTGDRETRYAATIEAAILAVLLDTEEADGMLRYLQEEESLESLAAFPLMLRAEKQPLKASDAVFSFQYQGKTVTRSLLETPIVILQFDEETMTAADFRVISGDVAYTALYMGGTETLEDNSQNRITITSTDPSPVRIGNTTAFFTTTVQFDEDCPGDTYLLDLVLPSGTRYAGYQYQHNAGYYLIAQEGNRLTFLIERRPAATAANKQYASPSQLRNLFSIRVSARAVLPGDYILEEPIVRGIDSGIIAIGQRRSLTIS